jgi:hypothetical protein
MILEVDEGLTMIDDSYLITKRLPTFMTLEALRVIVMTQCKHLVVLDEDFAPSAFTVLAVSEALLADEFLIFLVVTYHYDSYNHLPC